MNWSEDYEYPNDHIYAMEREKDIEASWQKWEEEQSSKNRKPAIIKIVKPIITDEAKYKSSTVRGAHQTKLQS
jgi:hypothetical protein